MKKTALALTSIMGLCLTIIGIQLLPLTNANFMLFYDLPTKPDTNPPLVTLHLPTQNQTFTSQNITLSFTVIKPETWIIPSKGKFVNGSEIYYVLGNITSFHYEVDEVKSENIAVQDISTVYLANPQRTLSFSINLTLPEGYHKLCVGVEGETIYRQGSVMDPFLSNMVQGVSEVVNFTITKPPEPFPTAFVLTTSVASVAVIGAGLLVYFKKRKH
ncbi:hypothetical protein JXA31_07610 [Candidatus Bathyarchaeota archaeon]|nr:hypothetical protein [Candidatus Bathyarchaeota archaeon]